MIKREQIYEAFDNGLIGLDEIIDISYNKAIDDVLEKLTEHYVNEARGDTYPQYNDYCNGVDYCIDIVEQLKVGDK